MLLQSQNGVINVLPALMPSLKAGSFTGLVARGGLEVATAWADGKVTNVTVESRLGNPLNVTLGTGQVFYLKDGGTAGGMNRNSTGTRYISMHTKRDAKYSFIAV